MKPLTHTVWRWGLALSGLLSWGAVLDTGTIHAELFNVTDLGTLGGYTSTATAINDAGQIVGNSLTAGNRDTHAFLYSNGTMMDLGTLGGSTSGATGINAQGQIVGASETSVSFNSPQAFLYANGTMTDLGTLGGSSSAAFGINGQGQVVGWAATTNNQTYDAFLYNNGAMTDLGSWNNQGHAVAINDLGDIVGDNNNHALLYSNGTLTDLGTLSGGFASAAKDINNAGKIVGWSYTNLGVSHGFLYSNGTMKDLGSFLGFTGNSQATGINNAGQIVGFSQSQFNAGQNHAFLYTSGKLMDLNNLLDRSGTGWTLLQADAVNNNGLIVGVGINPLGQSEAFLLTPVPLPGAVWLFGTGLLTLFAWRARPN